MECHPTSTFEVAMPSSSVEENNNNRQFIDEPSLKSNPQQESNSTDVDNRTTRPIGTDSQKNPLRNNRAFLNPEVGESETVDTSIGVVNQSKIIASRLCSLGDIITAIKTTPVIDPRVQSQIADSHSRRACYNETLHDLNRYRELSSLNRKQIQKEESRENAEVMSKLHEALSSFPTIPDIPDEETENLEKLLQIHQEKLERKKPTHDKRMQDIIRNARGKVEMFLSKGQGESSMEADLGSHEKQYTDEKHGQSSKIEQERIMAISSATPPSLAGFGSAQYPKSRDSDAMIAINQDRKQSSPPGQIQEELLKDWSFDKFMTHVATIVGDEDDDNARHVGPVLDIPLHEYEINKSGNVVEKGELTESRPQSRVSAGGTCTGTTICDATGVHSIDDLNVLNDIMTAQAAYLHGASQVNFARSLEKCASIVQNYISKQSRGESIPKIQESFIRQLPEFYAKIKEHSSH